MNDQQDYVTLWLLFTARDGTHSLWKRLAVKRRKSYRLHAEGELVHGVEPEEPNPLCSSARIPIDRAALHGVAESPHQAISLALNSRRARVERLAEVAANAQGELLALNAFAQEARKELRRGG